MIRARLAVLFVLLGWFTVSPSPVILLTAPVEVPPASALYLRKIEPQVLRDLRSTRDGRASFIVQFAGKPDLSEVSRGRDKSVRRNETVKLLQLTAEKTQKSALDDLERRQQAGEIESYSSLWIINGAAVKGDQKSVLALAARPDVEAIRADRRRYLPLPAEPAAEQMVEIYGQSKVAQAGIEWNISKIRADLVWSALGIDGSGAVVAVVDTGVDWQHPALINGYRGYSGRGLPSHNGNWRDFTPDAYQYPVDNHGHGTHVIGLVLGSEGSNQVGVAPGAEWIAARVFAGSGLPYADDSWIHSALQWILAPSGDPNLAPDIVNASWGSSESWDQTFKPDIEALLAAGITPVFAAGNDGPRSGSINSPASMDVAFAVGATDSSDTVAGFSSRGPSPWGKVKPDIAAPGFSIRSAYPGGSYAYMSGTSMATPQVAGVLALLKQARPELQPLQALGAITSTAVGRGSGSPNNDYGWGRIDAYGAVSQVMEAGSLAGVVRTPGGAPIAGAIVTATNQTSGAQIATLSGPDGAYMLALTAGMYDVRSGGFGYEDSPIYRVGVAQQQQTTRDFTLVALPTGIIGGTVVEAGSQRPLAATVSIVGTPLTVQTEPTTGAFSVTAPIGTYGVKVESEKHRVQFQPGVTVDTGATTALAFVLATAPSILLIDSGAWYSASQIGFYRAALDQLNYLYAVRPITDTRFIPTQTEMSRYDVVIWSSPLDSPGYIGADAEITRFLDGGGRLLLVGQDIGYYDGGGTALIYAPYFSEKLHADYVSDDAGVYDLSGAADGLFAGITLTLNTADSARNQYYPDVVAPRDNQAASIVRYSRGDTAGIETDICLPYRAIYLSFGLEGAGPTPNRIAFVERAIDNLTSQRPPKEARLLPPVQRTTQEAGKVATSTLAVWNTGTQADVLAISASGGWPVSLWDESFNQPLPSTLQLSSCQATTIGIKVDVPTGLGKDVANSALVAVSSLSDPGVHEVATVTVKTPAFVLLVDDDRWYDVESKYKNALFDLGYAYDSYDTHGGAGPPISLLSMYSITVWFTGYDWYQPLTAQDEATLAMYLDRGGRLFLSSQDYLYVRGLNEFGINYLGILSYTNDVTATVVGGMPGDILSDGLGPYTLTLPYEGFREWSDEVMPSPLASASFLNIFGVPTGINNLNGASRGRTVFFSFPFEGLQTEPARQVLDRVIGRGLATDLKADKSLGKPGEELVFEVDLFNPADVSASWAITSFIPTAAAYVAGSLEGGGTYVDALAGGEIRWQGILAPGQTKRLAYRIVISPSATGSITGLTQLEQAGKGVFTRKMTAFILPYGAYLPLVSRD